MSDVLPLLRYNLDFLPSPDPQKPGLFIRDPYRYSDSTLLVPPALVPALECFDGVQSALELRAELIRITGEIQVGDLEKHLFESLDSAGFLENSRYKELKAKREEEFAQEGKREAMFSGSGYPADGPSLRRLLDERIGVRSGRRTTIGIAAPHASLDGGWNTYKAAYSQLPTREEARDLTFVVLGTSHYGAPDRFGLTRKKFETPFGSTEANTRLVDELERGASRAIRMEDYCHAVEHSIEFQIVMLQYLYGPAVRVLPILCGPFVKSIYEGGLPENNENVRAFFETLGGVAAREGNKLFWILGVDMAHMGRRYGDALRARAKIGEMIAIEDRDRERIAQFCQGERAAYWSLVQNRHDDLKWCGSAPLYTFLKIMPDSRGELLDYHQWQIDPESVVSFAAIEFSDKG